MPQRQSARRVRPQPSRPRVLLVGPEGLTWEEAVEKFLASRADANATASTLSNYRWLLLGPRSRDFRRDNGIEFPRQLTADLLSSFSGELLKANLSAATAHAFHRSFKTFAVFCRQKGLGVEDAILDAKGPKQPQKDVEVFSAADEKALLAAARNPRDRLLLEFMLHTGLRLSEVCAITLDDFIQAPGASYVQVRQGKGRKDRFVPLDTSGYSLSKKLAHFIKSDRDQSEDRHLFLTERRVHGEEYTGLGRGAVQMIVRRLGKEAGVNANPHKFRHSFATRALRDGLDMIALRDTLGHSTIAMVSKYVHYEKADLIAAWAKMP